MSKKIIDILLLLILGLSIYWMLSPTIYLLKVLGIKNEIEIKSTGIMTLVRNFLPDILWAIAINQTAIELEEKKFPSFYIYALIILPFLSEFLQYIGFIPGTFDWYDLLIYAFVNLYFFNPKLIRLCKTNTNILSAH